MAHYLELELVEGDRVTPVSFVPQRFIVAGWTGRDRAAMEHHMDELEALGIKRPDSTPVFYRNSVTRLVQVDTLQTPGPGSSGEVEYVLFNIEGEIWVGVGSDHTDRDVEAYNITVSKQMCDKPVGRQLWRYADLRAVWDDLRVESHAVIDGAEVLYQQGTLAKMLSAEDLMAALEAQTGTPFGPGDVMMGGTLPAIGGVRPGSRFAFSLEDPRSGARLDAAYTIEVLDNVG
ncbi:DUF2848 domain-containing protein [Sulfitobacter albidus]|uniref:DUF2848 domain-containing protein n=1 Tax=Sulfitobacter albidus TaxID=2829501 RepID=A0A975JBZ7_9RHOB|nr:DUF2848 domain-containing protein [Sulfitobacter albidus]QUJ75689.1 DUF2848 domain-containing protein [Sulfitobacter albidus]